jgi:multidrug efflux pump subunit AcrB
VRRDGRRGVLMSVLKTGSSSTLDIIKEIKSRIPGIQTQLPQEFKIDLVGDQSIFVRGAISGVVREAIIAALLTALMILLFLGSWRSTLIIAISIPLSILASIVCLAAIGETINIMTLGGLALALGILVDDATVTIENINYHRAGEDEEERSQRRPRNASAGLRSTLAICTVIPMFMLVGIGLSVRAAGRGGGCCDAGSYVLSRTLVPTLAKYWLKHDPHAHEKVGAICSPAAWLERWLPACATAITRRARPTRAAAFLPFLGQWR